MILNRLAFKNILEKILTQVSLFAILTDLLHLETENIMRTFIPKEKDFNRKAYLIDADGKTLGRMATKVASLLMGKGKACFAYDKLSGDNVVIINASKVRVTGNKASQKVYTHYTGYPGGLRTYSYERMNTEKPDEIIIRAVKRMLPKTKLGREMLRRLRVYAGAEHNQRAQKLISLEG